MSRKIWTTPAKLTESLRRYVSNLVTVQEQYRIMSYLLSTLLKVLIPCSILVTIVAKMKGGVERAGFFAWFVLLVSRGCCVAFTRGATGLSAVCDCGIS